MLNLRKDLEELLEKYPDPRKDGAGLLEFEEWELRANPPPRYGIVSDNKDPRCLGRLRAACDMIAPGAVTDWIPMVNIGATKDTGWWQLPDIGTQVLLAFAGNCINCPVVLGCIHDLKHKPPEHSTKKAADSILYQTKSHRMEIIDIEKADGEYYYASPTSQSDLSLSKERKNLKWETTDNDTMLHIPVNCGKGYIVYDV